MTADSDQSNPAPLLLVIGVPLLTLGAGAVIATAFGSTLWIDALISGGLIAVIGVIATLWMVKRVSTAGVKTVPTTFLAGTGLLMLAVLVVGLGLILALDRDPVTVLLVGLAVCWSVLILDVVLVRRAIRTAPEIGASDTQSEASQKLAEVST
ncbi:MAG: hypothetical protein D8M59_05530 [Planctomycetes bacterium]|nr:hypothetical protein [Planctomycetota bacterium]NOG55961.1 hypothetical protein [Planctomycetota bacterium]